MTNKKILINFAKMKKISRKETWKLIFLPPKQDNLFIKLVYIKKNWLSRKNNKLFQFTVHFKTIDMYKLAGINNKYNYPSEQNNRNIQMRLNMNI